MKIVMTVMVRDEADIIGPMIEHHLAQGVDFFIVTDNGSVDGTTEILERFRDLGSVELRQDPLYRKQQAPTVTAMARAAYTEHAADWVLNADADEFWVAKDRSKTLREALQLVPKSVGAFPVPVIDMIGRPAMEGSGLARLVYRDLRPLDRLLEIGLLAHSTPDVAHVGSPDVTVVQGNHFVNIDSAGSPPHEGELEVLHLPWRSWSQYRRKVSNAGSAYENQSGLTPSPNHHGMRDYRRLQAGSLFGWYLVRHPTDAEIEAGEATGVFVEDRALIHVPDSVADVEVQGESARAQRALAASAGIGVADLSRAEARNSALQQELQQKQQELQQKQQELQQEVSEVLARLDTVTAELRGTHDLLRAERERKIVRFANALSKPHRRQRDHP